MTKNSKAHRPPLLAALLVPVVAAIVLTLFAWPAAKVGPRDLPVGVVGPAPQVAGVELHHYGSEGEAREAIKDRDVYGALVNGKKVLVATGASPVVAQMLTHAAQGAPVEDVVPAGPESSALAASVLPLVLAGILTGLLTSLLARGARRRVGLLLGVSLLTGLAANLIVQSWLGVIGGDWWANSAVLGLTVLAIASAVAGLGALFGKAGYAFAALTMIFVGNPLSGVATSPEMLPQGAGTLGQLLPPGAGGNLLRSTGFFDGAAAGSHLLVLTAWALAGFVLLTLSQRRNVGAWRVASPTS
jgi:hypothetical protein